MESAAQRQRFIDRLWALASDPRSGVTIVATLRVDYIGQCGELVLDGGRLRLDQLAYDEAHRVFIAQLGREQLRSTILGPAQRVGLILESGLAERIIEDVAGEPGSLPLIADTLDLLWQQRAGRCLTQAAYDALGGVTGALRQRADALIDGLGAGSQRAARRLLVRLVSNVEDTARGTRRRLPLAAVRPADRDEAASFDRLVQQLVEARLLVQDGEGSAQMIEVAHEALIRKWERLASWVLADRKMLAELEKLAGWVAQRAEHQTLLDDNQLGYATLVKSRYPDDLPAGASELIAASRDASNGRRRTRQRTILALIVLSLTSLAFGGYGLERSLRAERASEKERLARQDEQAANRDVLEKKESLRQKLIDTYIEQGRQYLVEQRDAVRALLWFNRAYQQGSTSKALPFLLAQSYYELDSLLLTIPGGIRITNTEMRRLAVGAAPIFSPDGNRLLTADGQSGSARLFDAQTSKPLQSLGGHRGPVTALAFSLDGQRIATASMDGNIKLWDAATASELASFAASGAVTALSFNKDGSLLAVASARALELWEVANQQRRWHRGKEEAGGQPPSGDGYSAVAFSPDEERVVGSGHYAASAWTVAKGKACWSFPPEEHEPEPFRSFYGSGSDQLLMVLGREEDRQDSVLHSGVTGKSEGSVLHSATAFTAAFNAPGTRLLIGDWSDGVRLWNPRTREQVLALPSDNVLYAASFSATGAYFAGVSPTGGRLWLSESGRIIQSLVAKSQRLMGVAISSAGNRLATAAEDGTVMLWDITRNALGVGAIRSPAVDKLLLDAVKYPDSPSDAEPPKGQVYLRSQGGKIVEVYAPGDQLLWRLNSGGNTTRSAMSPDGSLIVTWSASYDGEMGEPAGGVSVVRIWAVESGKLLYELTQDAALLFAAAMDGVGPDGKQKSALPAELLRRPPGREQLNAFVSARLPLHFEGESLVENQK